MFMLVDILIINLVVFYISDEQFLNRNFLIYSSLFWIVSTLIIGYYKVYRYTKIFHVITLIVTQLFLFSLGFFTYFGLFREGDIVGHQTYILVSILSGVAVFKITSFYLLKKYRSFGKNYRRVIVIGEDESSLKLISLFNQRKNLGYRYLGFFSDKKPLGKKHLGNLEDCKSYILKNQVDEIYCTTSQLSETQVIELTKFSNDNDRSVKLIPNANELYSKNTLSQYYEDSMLILNVKRLPFEYRENHIFKRIFDVVFSLFVFVFVLSWLAPIFWIIIKLESKGPAFFKQKREGIQGTQFTCFKFRSMKFNHNSHEVHATKNDNRVTAFGALLRKTSLDELPQFYNVLKGDMSVVGPRPHLKNLSLEYQKDVDNYIDRHAIKPGITGLAQVSGYRGEIRNKSDIQNRVRLDIFYIENWSFFLDVKIIFQTIFNVFKGEEKAY